ncbi:ngoPIIM [Symbiodinium sp. CCMP2592]|nr:ngoPIIM [Symbiodinium sp. CCMP2592]
MADDHLDTEIAGYRAGRVLRVLGRPLRVTEPCVGLGGLRRLCELSGSQYLSTQGFDTEASLLPYYNNLQRFCGASGVQALRLGTDGDVEKVNPESLLPVEAIVAGPPCQPWAGTGQQQGTADARASVMDVCIGWIIAQAWQGQLLAFAVENSPRLRGTPYLRELLQRLRACIPMFAVSVEVHDLCQLCPQHRERLWIRGLRRDCLRGLPGLPPPLSMKDLGGKVKVPLETVLVEKHGDGKVLKPTDPGSLCPNMQCNLAAYLSRVQGDIENGKAGEIAVIELDRNPLKDFGGGIVYDGTPPLRTKGPKLWLLRTQDVKEKRPWQEHSLHRYMLQEEDTFPRADNSFHLNSKARCMRQQELWNVDLDSSGRSGSRSPSTVSLVSRHVHQLDLQLRTLSAHVTACERRIREVERQLAELQQVREPQSASFWDSFRACFPRS